MSTIIFYVCDELGSVHQILNNFTKDIQISETVFAIVNHGHHRVRHWGGHIYLNRILGFSKLKKKKKKKSGIFRLKTTEQNLAAYGWKRLALSPVTNK